MATSGTVGTTTLDNAKVIEHAIRRCGIAVASQTPEMVEMAKDNLYALLLALSNRGLNLWCVENDIIPLVAGKAEYVLEAGTLDVLNVNYSRPTLTSSTLTTTTSQDPVNQFITIRQNGDDSFASETGTSGWVLGSLPASRLWTGVAHGDGRLVAVASGSDKGAVSLDRGVTWDEVTLPQSASWSNITYSSDLLLFVAVSYDGVSAASRDGINWVAGSMPVVDFWQPLTYGAGLFVSAVYNSDVAATSDDGINWIQRTLPEIGSWFPLVYGAGLFVMVQPLSTVYVTSIDGINWTRRSNFSSSQNWLSGTYGAGQFVFTSNTYNKVSVGSGTTWVEYSLPSSGFWRSVTFGNGTFVAIRSPSKYAYSTTAQTWTEGTFSGGSADFIVYDGDPNTNIVSSETVADAGGSLTVLRYGFTPAADFTAEMTVSYSVDGVTYTVLDTLPETGWVAGTWYWFDTPVSVEAQYLKLAAAAVAFTLEEVYIANAVYDQKCTQWNRDDYADQPNKRQPSRTPTNYLFQKLINPSITLWPVPTDSTDQLVVWRHRQPQDVGTLMNELEIPQRWIEGIIWQLAARLCFEIPGVDPNRIQMVVEMSQKHLVEAEISETDGSAIYFQPAIGVYSR